MYTVTKMVDDLSDVNIWAPKVSSRRDRIGPSGWLNKVYNGGRVDTIQG